MTAISQSSTCMEPFPEACLPPPSTAVRVLMFIEWRPAVPTTCCAHDVCAAENASSAPRARDGHQMPQGVEAIGANMPDMPSWISPRPITTPGRLGGKGVDFKSSRPFNGDGYRCGKDGHWGQGQAPRSEPPRPGEGACRSRSARQAARKRRQARPTNVTAQDGRRPPQEGVQEVGKEDFSCVPERDKHRGNSATSTSSPTLDVRSDARQLIPPRVGVVRQVASARAAHAATPRRVSPTRARCRGRTTHPLVYAHRGMSVPLPRRPAIRAGRRSTTSLRARLR